VQRLVNPPGSKGRKTGVLVRLRWLELNIDRYYPPQKLVLPAIDGTGLHGVLELKPGTQLGRDQGARGVIDIPTQRWIDIRRP
jgi:hypothetical protein